MVYSKEDHSTKTALMCRLIWVSFCSKMLYMCLCTKTLTGEVQTTSSLYECLNVSSLHTWGFYAWLFCIKPSYNDKTMIKQNCWIVNMNKTGLNNISNLTYIHLIPSYTSWNSLHTASETVHITKPRIFPSCTIGRMDIT